MLLDMFTLRIIVVIAFQGNCWTVIEISKMLFYHLDFGFINIADTLFYHLVNSFMENGMIR